MTDIGQQLKQALETGNAEAWASLYSEDLELDELWHKTDPPSNPNKRGRDDLAATIERATSNGVKFEVDNVVSDGDRLAYTVKCLLPSGRVVVTNSIAEIKDGVIVRELQVGAGEPDA